MHVVGGWFRPVIVFRNETRVERRRDKISDVAEGCTEDPCRRVVGRWRIIYVRVCLWMELCVAVCVDG